MSLLSAPAPHPDTTFDDDLTLADRCDAPSVAGAGGRGPCGAQAFVRAVMMSGMDLLFCAHHGDQHEAMLREQGARLVDERERINLKPTDPSQSQDF